MTRTETYPETYYWAMSLKDDPSCLVRPYSLIPVPVNPKGNRSCPMGHMRASWVPVFHVYLKVDENNDPISCWLPFKVFIFLLPFTQASKCYNISNIVVYVCVYRKLVGMLKRKENLTHSLTYLCSATYSINGKDSRFFPNTLNILAPTQTSVSFAKPRSKKKHCLA